jgi:outer membrane protein assembly factor BamB
MKWKVRVGFLALIIFSNVANAQSCGWTPIPPTNSACGTWQMYQGYQKHTGIQRMKANMSSGRFVKWSYTTGDWVQSSPAIGDINNDGIPDVVVGSEDRKIYALRGDNGSLLWSYTTGNRVYSSPAIGDINNDGIPDVVVGSWDRKIYALRGDNGSLLWSYTTGNLVSSSPAIGDINNDGIPDVVVGSWDYKIYALRGDNGSLLWSYTTGNRVYSSPAIGDINNDGIPDVVVGSWDYKIYALRGDNGSLLWSYTTGDWVESSPAIGDINNDGIPDVVVGSFDYKIYALRGDNGSLLWSYTTGNWVQSSPAIGDINNDGIPEVVVGSSDYKIYALRGDNGSLLWSVSLPFPQYWPDGIKLADIDPSQGLEVIASTLQGSVYVISSNGTVLWSMAPVWGMRNSSVGDVDNDNCVEIVVVGEGTPMVAVIDAPGSNCGTITPVEISETNKINYQIEKNGIKLNRAVNYELFSANGRLIKKGYGDFIKIKNKGIYFLKAESEVLKFVID